MSRPQRRYYGSSEGEQEPSAALISDGAVWGGVGAKQAAEGTRTGCPALSSDDCPECLINSSGVRSEGWSCSLPSTIS